MIKKYSCQPIFMIISVMCQTSRLEDLRPRGKPAPHRALPVPLEIAPIELGDEVISGLVGTDGSMINPKPVGAVAPGHCIT